MTFKGGTSLSKAFNLINRFSEDIDITIDYKSFIDIPDLDSLSKSKQKRISEKLTCILNNYPQLSHSFQKQG